MACQRRASNDVITYSPPTAHWLATVLFDRRDMNARIVLVTCRSVLNRARTAIVIYAVHVQRSIYPKWETRVVGKSMSRSALETVLRTLIDHAVKHTYTRRTVFDNFTVILSAYWLKFFRYCINAHIQFFETIKALDLLCNDDFCPFGSATV